MDPTVAGLARRIESLRMRIGSLSALRSLVALSPGDDITPWQWSVLEPQLGSVQARLLARLKRAGDAHLTHAGQRTHACRLNALLGEIELEASTAFTFFDTYVDVLTQRHAPGLGPILAGCDVLAWDAIRRDHPALALVEPPLVYCDRGFGASILRERVPFPGRTPNPMPLIQIPYSRLKQKYSLTSVLHEAGHEALVRLGLVPVIPDALRAALARRGASRTVQELFALWALEIGPDFWTFCLAGSAGPAGLRDLLSLPPEQVFRVSWTDPHPPPYLRVLLSLQWCRQVWGQGDWDGWERQWRACYPLRAAGPSERAVLREARTALPTVAATLLHTRFRALGGRTLTTLFDLPAVNPARLRPGVTGLAPCGQLAAFRALRDRTAVGEETLDALMTKWLAGLGRRRHAAPTGPATTEGETRHAA